MWFIVLFLFLILCYFICTSIQTFLKKFPESSEKVLIKETFGPLVIVSLTTSPKRIKYLPEVINSLDINLVDEIHINLSKLYRNEMKYSRDDIDSVQKLSKKIKIFYEEYDIGPLLKLVPSLKRLKEGDSVVITIDDDIKYPFSMIHSLLEEHKKNPREILCLKSFIFRDYINSDIDRKLWPSPEEPSKPYSDIAEGWSGVLYPVGEMSENIIKDLLKFNQASKVCKYSDDLVISYVMTLHGIPIKNIETNLYENLIQLEHGHGSDALRNGSGLSNMPLGNYFDQNMMKYKICIKDIQMIV